MKGALGPTDVQRAAAGELPVRKLFSKEQRAFFAAHAPEGVTLDDLTMLGPILILKQRFTPKELNRRLVAEMWVYPDGSRVLELSTRCGTTEAFQVAAEVRAFLAGRGVDISGEQETKTRKALAVLREEREGRRRVTPRARDRAPMGVADVRRALRRGGHPLRRGLPRQRPGERRGLFPLARERRVGEGSRRADGREAARARERRWARTVETGSEGFVSPHGRGLRRAARRARCCRSPARRATRTRSTRSSTASCGPPTT